MPKKLRNVCLLATDHNVCKAYLAQLSQLGLVPEQIIFFHRETPKSIRSYVRRALGKIRDFASTTENSKSLEQSRLWLANFCQVQGHVMPEYSQKTTNLVKTHPAVVHIVAPNINSQAVIEALSNCSQQFVIFCGGGILRRAILSLPKRFIHIHPGVVPEVKGADGILWSSLVRRRIGMSAFFMNKGIDTGDIIKTQEYDIPSLPIIDSQTSNSQGLAKFIVNEVDPVFRASLLGMLFREEPNPNKWTSTAQNPDDGKTYYFMHEKLKEMAVEAWRNDQVLEDSN